MPSVAVLGATGACGRHILKELLLDPHFTSVTEFGRRVTTPESLPQAINPPNKLQQKVIDFENLSAAGLTEPSPYDVVVIALATTRANAGSAENFVKIDREYVLEAAKKARVTSAKQRLLYVSAGGASSTSPFLYTKSKGLTEEGLASLGYETIILRPGFLAEADRGETRIAETLFGYVTGALSRFSPNLEVKTADVGKACLVAAKKGLELGPEVAVFTAGGNNNVPEYHCIPNKGLLELAKLH